MAVSFVGTAAPIAAFVAITRRRARRVCTAEHSDSGRSAAEDGGPAAFLLREECREVAAGEESRGPPLWTCLACRPIALSKAGARRSPARDHAHAGPRAVTA